MLSARVIHTDARFPFGFALETCLAVLLSPLCTYLLPCSHTLIFVLIRHLFSYFLLSQNTMVNAVMCWPNVEIRIRAIDAQYGSKGVFFCARGGGGNEKSPCKQGLKIWSQWSGLNRRPAVYETAALPLSYTGLICLLLAVYDHCLAALKKRL